LDIKVIIRIHDFICMERTGSPKELSQRLGISTRTLYEYIAFMKNELYAPITYNKNNQTYMYNMECDLCFISKKENKESF